ncbi:MAG: type II secretion system protein [Burkholderiales bacterium]|jgi:general secretion pathway protein G
MPTDCRPSRARGFTLVEVLVVLAIISLMVAIAVPRYVDRLEDAREAALRENLKVMRVAIDRFQADTGRFPRSLEELVERRYLSGVPLDPVTERTDTWIEIAAADTDPGATGVGDVRSGAEGAARKGGRLADL